jgi:hypothetical protein
LYFSIIYFGGAEGSEPRPVHGIENNGTLLLCRASGLCRYIAVVEFAALIALKIIQGTFKSIFQWPNV